MQHNPKMLAEIQNGFWALDEASLLAIIGATTAEIGTLAQGARIATKAGNVAVVDITGPIVSRDGFLAKIFGLNSVEQISADLRALADDDEITDIVLHVDTPGGTVTGLNDLSEQIAASPKRVTAYVAGLMASAGYWVGSAASNIVASPTALVGSIGVVATVTPWAEPGQITVVSSQTPDKNIDPKTQKGIAGIQKTVDGLADIFIATVAKNRGATIETVKEGYGRGRVLLARDALDAGMIDGISSLQNLMDSLSAVASGKTREKGKKMDLKTLQTEHAGVFEAAVNVGVERERKRVESHMVMAEASGDMATAIEAIASGAELDALYTARYQAAGMKRAQLVARAADNPQGIVGERDSKPAKSEAEIVAEAVLDGMTFYAEGGV